MTVCDNFFADLDGFTREVNKVTQIKLCGDMWVVEPGKF